MLAVDHYPKRKTSWNAPTLKWKSHKPHFILSISQSNSTITTQKTESNTKPKKTKREPNAGKKKLDFKKYFLKTTKALCEKTKITKIQNFNQELEKSNKTKPTQLKKNSNFIFYFLFILIQWSAFSNLNKKKTKFRQCSNFFFFKI